MSLEKGKIGSSEDKKEKIYEKWMKKSFIIKIGKQKKIKANYENGK